MAGRLLPLVAQAGLVLAAVGGMLGWNERLREERGREAVQRLRTAPFGEGRHTRLDGSLRALETERGPAAFRPDPPWFGGATEVAVSFGETPHGRFRVGEGPPEPLDEPARALAARLAATPPPAAAPSRNTAPDSRGF